MDWNGIRDWITAEGTGHWFFVAFPIALLCLFIMFRGRRARFLIPSLLITIVIVNPVFYRIWDQLGLYAYWRILWIIPVIPVIGCVVPMITERIQKPWVKGIGAAVGIGAIVLSGTLLYSGSVGRFTVAANAAKLPQDVVEIADKLLELEERPRVVLQHPLGVYMRQYTGEIDQLYGRDLEGFVMSPSVDARTVHHALSDRSSGNMTAVAQFMIDDDYDYLVYNGSASKSFEMIDAVANYDICKSLARPTVIKVRDSYGRVTSITTVDEDGRPVNNELGYASIHHDYDQYGNIIDEFRLNEQRNKYIQPGGYAEVIQRWNAEGNILLRKYLDEAGNAFQGYEGYSEIRWERDGNVWNSSYYNLAGQEIPAEGLNLARGIEVGNDGWSAWMTPEQNVKDYCYTIGYANLGKKKTGDMYTCHVEIEFKNVTAGNESFRFRSQGSVDKSWNVYNPWNNYVYLAEPPEDGIYTFQVSYRLNENMAQSSEFELGFRCDYWSSGSFRVRNVIVTRGEVVAN